MSQKDNGEMVIVYGFLIVVGTIFYVILFAIYIALIVMFVVASLTCIVFTILALLAWNKPLPLGETKLYPPEARAFIYRGLLGAGIAPILALIVCAMIDQPVTDDALLFIVWLGYLFGSLGILFLMDEDEAQTAAPQTQTLNHGAPSTEEPASLPAPPKQSFQYASWDDEEARS